MVVVEAENKMHCATTPTGVVDTTVLLICDGAVCMTSRSVGPLSDQQTNQGSLSLTPCCFDTYC